MVGHTSFFDTIILHFKQRHHRLPGGLEEKLKSYQQKVQKKRNSGKFPTALIGNTDETPVYFDIVLGKGID